ELLRMTLKFCYFGKVEITHLHGRNHHVKRLLTTGAHGPPQCFNAGKQLDQALIEAEIPDTVFGLAILDEEGAVARHSCEKLLVGINLADIPQPSDQNSTLRLRNHLLNRLLAPAGDEDNVGWRFAHLIGQRETMSCGRDFPHFAGVIRVTHSFRSAARIDKVLDYAFIYQRNLLAPDALAIKRHC